MAHAPFSDETQNPRRKPTVSETHGVDVDYRAVIAILNVEVWWWMVVGAHDTVVVRLRAENVQSLIQSRPVR